MSEIHEIKPFIQLIQRSRDVGDGWRAVSPILRKLIELRVGEDPELYETRDGEDGLFIRMTSDAQVLARYI